MKRSAAALLLVATSAMAQVYVAPFCKTPQAGYERATVDTFLADMLQKHGDNYQVAQQPKTTTRGKRPGERYYIAEAKVDGGTLPVFVTSSQQGCRAAVVEMKKMFKGNASAPKRSKTESPHAMHSAFAATRNVGRAHIYLSNEPCAAAAGWSKAEYKIVDAPRPTYCCWKELTADTIKVCEVSGAKSLSFCDTHYKRAYIDIDSLPKRARF